MPLPTPNEMRDRTKTNAQMRELLANIVGGVLENALFEPIRINSTDLNTVLTKGFYLIVNSASATMELNFPVAKIGMLSVFKAPNSSAIIQRYEPFDASAIYYRDNTSGSMSLWKNSTDSPLIAEKFNDYANKSNSFLMRTALGTSDLNTITTIGIYPQTSGGNATLARNYPVAGVSGFLEVLQGTATSIVVQRFTSLDGKIVLTRRLIPGSWSTWESATAYNLDSSTIEKLQNRAEVFFPNGLVVNYDVNTRVLSWNATLTLASKFNANNRINISPSSLTLPEANFLIVYIDTTQLPENGNISDASTSPAIKVASYNSGYVDKAENIPLVKVYDARNGHKAHACAGFPPVVNLGIPTPPAPDPTSVGELLSFSKSLNSLEFIKRGVGNDALKFSYNRFVSAESQLDAWGMSPTHKVDADLNIIKTVVTDGVWETALMPAANIDDHSGGTHGDELQTAAYFFIDGIYTTQDAVVDGVCKTIQTVQKSQVFIQGTSNLFCNKTQVWNIDANKMTLDVELSFPNEIDTKQLWIGMLPILRDNVTNKQIRSTNFDVIDVSTTSFNRNEEIVKGGDYVILSGDDVSVKVTVEKMETPFTPFWFVANSSLYNKIYISACSRDIQTIPAGSRIRVRTTYEFNTH